MKKYNTPVIELNYLNSADVITASGLDVIDGEAGEGSSYSIGSSVWSNQ